MTDVQDPFAIAADLLDPPDDTWEPLPHQVPPPGQWFSWLLMGGRGAGKTATAARYMYEHVMGPPCLPNVPGGHWCSIIAPTLGDGVTACVNGPSGLRAHDPGIKVKATAGGTFARFSNGAEAKIFGASSPEDVERLRAGGNRCFAKGTLILTQLGYVPVEQITTDDLAMTRQGLLPIDRAGLVSDSEPIWELQLSNGRMIRCTYDHKFLVDGEWVEAQDLVPYDTMTVCPAFTPMNTSRSGKQPTGLSRQATTSTTSTRTRATTGSRTSSASPSRNTGSVTTKSVALTGIRKVARLLGSSAPWSISSAWSARNRSGRRFLRQARALMSAEQPVSSMSTVASSGSRSSATTAASHTSTADAGSPVSVVRSAATGAHEAVYCLRVPGPNELVVEGVVARNCFVWAEELAAWRYMEDCWQHMRYGLRIGPWPHVIISTTPKARKLIKTLVKKAIDSKVSGERSPEVVMTKASTADNPHLDARVKAMLYEDYAGTRVGRQELYAELLEDIEGALWTPEMIEEDRIRDMRLVPGKFDYLVVGVDPAMAKDAVNAEWGIVVTGLVNRWNVPMHQMPEQDFVKMGRTKPFSGADYVDAVHRLSHGFVLGDYSGRYTPEKAARVIINAMNDWGANKVIGETNNGGDLVRAVIHAADSNIPFEQVWASRGKAIRAEPISQKYEQHRVHHVGMHPTLEEQMTSFDPIDPDQSWSPDRMDAMVWALWKLMVTEDRNQVTTIADQRLRGRR